MDAEQTSMPSSSASASSEPDDEVVETKPLAATRSRRTNAGNRMGNLILEEDDLYNNLYGGFNDEEDDGDFQGEEGAEDDEADSDFSNDESDEAGQESRNAEEEPKGKKNNSKDSKSKRASSSNTKENGKSSSKSRSPAKSRPSRSKKREAQLSIAAFIKEEEQPDLKYQFTEQARICSVCLNGQVDEEDEVIECDSCGVTVHESCYGVNCGDDQLNDGEVVSIESNLSSESTEPWFCEPCKRSVYQPMCELCPNLGGIFKETDTGRWVHMVCALYIRGVTFEDVDTLKDVSLFELNYSLYGSKTCTICEDQRLARSGICIECDAGLCKTFFHATCAQKEGLLFESQSDEVDPFFAQCKLHADKTVIKSKKRSYTALFARLNRTTATSNKPDRIKEKLQEYIKQPHPQITKWKPDNLPPIPHKSAKMLLTSPSLIIRLTKKSELMGLDTNSSFMLLQDESDMARQRWHIPPAFSLEFIAYCLDRTPRLLSMKEKNSELIQQNDKLKREESTLREKFNGIKESVTKLRSDNDNIIKEIRAIQKLVTTQTGEQFNLQPALEQLIARSFNTKRANPSKAPKHSAAPPSATHDCNKCKTTKDQHLLCLCDTCSCYFHIYCLDPPLTRVPKKTKFGGWQCSDCSERDEEEQEEALEEQITLATAEADGPRKLRERIKYPEKYCHESMIAANFWSAAPRRKSKKSSKCSVKKPKLEPQVTT